MTTAALALTTSLQDTSVYGSRRQIGVSGGSADLIVDIYISDDATHASTLVRTLRLNGATGLLPLTDSSLAMKYVIVRGNLGESGGVWLQADQPGGSFVQTAVSVLSTATNVSAAVGDRQLAWVGASADFIATIYALESALLAPVETIDGASGCVQLPNDVSASMKYVVTRGSLQGGKIWIQGAGVTPG